MMGNVCELSEGTSVKEKEGGESWCKALKAHSLQVCCAHPQESHPMAGEGGL